MLELLASVNRLRRRNAPVFMGPIWILAACANPNPSHLPNPVLLPGYAVSNAIQNASYNARRARIKTHLTKNFDAVKQEITDGGGKLLAEGYDLARVPASKRPALTAMLRAEPNLSQDAEALTVTMMVHGT